MPRRDFTLTLVAVYLTGIFLLPTLLNTGFLAKLPSPYLVLFVGLPILAVVGMMIANLIGKRIAILWQLAKFGFVGLLNTAIDFGVLNLLIFLTSITSGLGIIFINAASFSTAVINSFFWNKKWVFSAGKKGNFLVFVAVTFIGLSINTGVVYGLTTYSDPIIVKSPTQWANLAKLLATGLSLIWNFAGYKLIVFKK